MRYRVTGRRNRITYILINNSIHTNVLRGRAGGGVSVMRCASRMPDPTHVRLCVRRCRADSMVRTDSSEWFYLQYDRYTTACCTTLNCCDRRSTRTTPQASSALQSINQESTGMHPVESAARADVQHCPRGSACISLRLESQAWQHQHKPSACMVVWHEWMMRGVSIGMHRQCINKHDDKLRYRFQALVCREVSGRGLCSVLGVG